VKTQLIEDQPKQFQPVTLQVTFETKAELAAFLLLTNRQKSMHNAVVEELELNPSYAAFKPNSINFNDFLCGNLWSDLNDKLFE